MASTVKPKTPLLTNAPSTKIRVRTWENKECKCLIFTIPIFHPFGQFRMTWDSILIIVLIISAIEIPFTSAFNIHIALTNFIGILIFAIDIFLCIDILINFRTAYFDEIDPLQLITSPKYIAKKYLKTRFIFDFLTSFPFEFIFLKHQNVVEYIKVLRILRIVRLLRVVRVVKMMRLFDKLPRKLSISSEYVIYIKITKVFFGMILGAHYFACLWWVTGKYMVKQGYDSWIQNVPYIEINTIDDLDGLLVNYTYSYYWSIVTLFTTGFGDIVAMNALECWVSVFCIVVGTVYVSYLIGLATYLVTEGDHVKKLQDEELKNALMFCEHHDLSDKLYHAVEAHIRYHHTYNYVLCDAENEVLKNLPKHLRKDIELEIAGKTLKDIDFLNEFLPLPLIGQIAIKMRSISCNAGHYLYKKNDIGNEMYIQRTGVSMIYYHNQLDYTNDTMNHKTHRGDVIGESILYSKKRKHSLKCLSWSEFYVLTVDDIKSVIFTNYVNGDKLWNKIQHKVRNLNGKQRRNIYGKYNVFGIHDNLNRKCKMEKKQMIHDLSNQAYRLKTKGFGIRQGSYDGMETPPPYSSLNDMVITDSMNSVDADIMNNNVRNSNSSPRIRFNSDNRNEAVLNHFQYQHIHLKSSKHSISKMKDEIIETDASIDSSSDDADNHCIDNGYNENQEDFELVEMKEVEPDQNSKNENTQKPFSTTPVDYRANEKLWNE